ncbi:hypothetical protein F5Y09DRAFT_178152 [Xylaria sp. FL1042]|nr:hypothetical protein F5Y09DRAFT_178152 [Xylaria sp. FL1042]
MEDHGKSRVLTDDLFDGPLDHVIRNHPKLFVHPLRWTHKHAILLHVTCMDEPSLFPVSNKDGRIKHDEHRSSGQDADKSRIESDSQLPKTAKLQLEPQNGRVGTRDTGSAAKNPRLNGISSVLSKEIEQSTTVPSTLSPSQLVADLMTQTPMNGIHISDKKQRQENVKVEEWTPIEITYGDRATTIISNARIYTLGNKTPSGSRHLWRMIFLHRSELEQTPPSRRRWRPRLLLGSSTQTHSPSAQWKFNAGCMAGLFIALAQRGQAELEEKKSARRRSTDLRPRYQIGVSDVSCPEPCVHLYTAEVSDLLLAHFRTPARLPQNAPSRDKDKSSPLIKIHRVVISQVPRKSLRRRLRAAVTHYANGTVGGFFPDRSEQ